MLNFFRRKKQPIDGSFVESSVDYGLAEYNRRIAKNLADGWMQWEFSSPPAGQLVEARYLMKDTSTVIDRAEMPGWVNIANLWWRPWRGGGAIDQGTTIRDLLAPHRG